MPAENQSIHSLKHQDTHLHCNSFCHMLSWSWCLLSCLVFSCATNGASSAAEETSPTLANAIEAQDWKTAAALLKQDVDVDALQADGMSALHWACFHNQTELVKALVEKGADVNLANRYDTTSLVIASEQGFAEVAELLLRAGAEPNAILPGAVTPLMLAARNGDAKTVSNLLEHGANIDVKERKGQTALMWAASEGNVEAVDVLLKAGADLECHLKSGFNAMMFAAREGRIAVVARLLEAGADVNAIMPSSVSGNRAPRKGTSALTLAVESGHFELAIFLVRNGADPDDQRSGYAPLHSLSWVRKPKRGEEPDGDPPPRGSGQMTSLEFAKAIVDLGANVNLRLEKGKGGKAVLNHRGATPMLLAGKTADLAYLKVLLELGGDLTLTNVEGTTPLIAVAGVGVRAVGEEPGTVDEVIETIDFFIEHGLDVNAVDENGETAMHGAAYRNFPEVVKHLAARGARADDWNHKNKSGWTPIMIAQGKRPGSFKPSPVTVAALEAALQAGE